MNEQKATDPKVSMARFQAREFARLYVHAYESAYRYARDTATLPDERAHEVADAAAREAISRAIT